MPRVSSGLHRGTRGGWGWTALGGYTSTPATCVHSFLGRRGPRTKAKRSTGSPDPHLTADGPGCENQRWLFNVSRSPESTFTVLTPFAAYHGTVHRFPAFPARCQSSPYFPEPLLREPSRGSSPCSHGPVPSPPARASTALPAARSVPSVAGARGARASLQVATRPGRAEDP